MVGNAFEEPYVQGRCIEVRRIMDPGRFLPLTPQQFHILLALVDGDCHGYGIILAVERRTEGQIRLGTGTLYTALARLVHLELVADTERDDARRRFYRLTALGRSVLRAETARLEALVRQAHASGVRGAARAAAQQGKA
jgi:DNA-binding PadR family transcriptional regulator